MRIRSVLPAFWSSEQVASVGVLPRLLFVGLWNYADDEGRGLDNPRLIRAALFALDDEITSKKVDAAMAELASARLVVRYEVQGKKLFAIPSFRRHQKPRRFVASKLPAPPHWMVEHEADTAWTDDRDSDGAADPTFEDDAPPVATSASEHSAADVRTRRDNVRTRSVSPVITEPERPHTFGQTGVGVGVGVGVGEEGSGEGRIPPAAPLVLDGILPPAPAVPAPVASPPSDPPEVPSPTKLAVVDGDRAAWNGRMVPAALMPFLLDPTLAPPDDKRALDVLWEAYCALVAPVNYGRFRKEVGAQVRPLGYGALRNAITVFREVRMSRDLREQGFLDLSKFLTMLPELIRFSKMPIMDDDGGITERGWAGVYWTPTKAGRA